MIDGDFYRNWVFKSWLRRNFIQFRTDSSNIVEAWSSEAAGHIIRSHVRSHSVKSHTFGRIQHHSPKTEELWNLGYNFFRPNVLTIRSNIHHSVESLLIRLFQWCLKSFLSLHQLHLTKWMVHSVESWPFNLLLSLLRHKGASNNVISSGKVSICVPKL